jgi:hypothetical protein
LEKRQVGNSRKNFFRELNFPVYIWDIENVIIVGVVGNETQVWDIFEIF